MVTGRTPRFERWDRGDLGRLVTLVTDALPDEVLTADELQAGCWDDPDTSVVLATADDTAAAAGVIRVRSGDPVGHVRLVAVAVEFRRRGLGRAAVDALESWFAGKGVKDVQIGGEAPFYLWPGVDVRQTAALCLFEAAGYGERGAVCNMSCPSSFRCPPPPGVDVTRVLTEDDAEDVVALADTTWPWWRAEIMRAIDHGSCLAARGGDREVLGFGCHSVNRGGWIGPLGTVPRAQGRRIGSAMLGALCADLAAAGYRRAEIAWVGPMGFYARAADAHVSRVFQSRSRRL